MHSYLKEGQRETELVMQSGQILQAGSLAFVLCLCSLVL